jgi:hypothetical protein
MASSPVLFADIGDRHFYTEKLDNILCGSTLTGPGLTDSFAVK